MSLWIIWLIVGLVLVVAEMTTFTFYLLWLGIGAFAGCILAMVFPESLLTQIIGACVVAILLTYFTKPFIKKRVSASKGYVDKFDLLIGKRGEVQEAIVLDGLGIVRVGNETWSANADEDIGIGEAVIILDRSSTVLKVEKLKT